MLVTEVRERRTFVVRTPSKQLVIPALGERGDPRATLLQAEEGDNDAIDYPGWTLNERPTPPGGAPRTSWP